ncbi:hypothetical protein [Streptomyces termitum]|uniref:hypothetical protein n=1 Tax=Streptomyces termitum TaxID=67368 RepID=UPI0033B48F5D
MPASKASAEDIAARLSALGFTPRVERHAHETTVEAEVPDPVPSDTWWKALEAVARADRFGLLAGSENGRVLWATVHGAAPAPDERNQPA